MTKAQPKRKPSAEETAALQALVEEVSLTFFKQPFLHKATYNLRLKTTGGRYHLKSHNLDFNYDLAKQYEPEVLIGIIKHELCHYHLHIAGKGYRHRDKDFKLLLKKVGGSRYAPAIKREEPQKIHHYQCQKCGCVFTRKRRINLSRYGCRCGGKLKLLETE